MIYACRDLCRQNQLTMSSAIEITYLENTNGTSNKHYTIQEFATHAVMHYGRIGAAFTKGCTMVKNLSDIEIMIKAKTKKGYVACTMPDDHVCPSLAIAQAFELEKAAAKAATSTTTSSSSSIGSSDDVVSKASASKSKAKKRKVVDDDEKNIDTTDGK